MKPLIYVVGFGPGDRPYMTQQAIDAVTQADLVVGYTTYIQLLEEQFPELRYYATPMRKETDRCRAAVEAALTGKTVDYPQTQARPHCHCLQVTDLGEYNSCAHHCRYCYANFDEAQIARRRALHDPQSTLLIGHVQPDDQIITKKKSERQLRLF